MPRIKRTASIAANGATVHLVVARHGDGTITVLCPELRVRETPTAPGAALCTHCSNVLRDLNAAARAA